MNPSESNLRIVDVFMLFWCIDLDISDTMFPKYLQNDVLESIITIAELEILLIFHKPPPSKPIKRKMDEHHKEKFEVKKIKNIVYQTFPFGRRIKIKRKYSEFSTPISITKKLLAEIDLALDKVKAFMKRNSLKLGNFRSMTKFDDLEFVLVSIIGNKKGKELYKKFLMEINKVSLPLLLPLLTES